MIYTVTFNPSLDYIVSMNGFEMGKTNRTISEQMFIGGKGINVSIVLRNLGIENTARVSPENRSSAKCERWGCLRILSGLRKGFHASMSS